MKQNSNKEKKNPKQIKEISKVKISSEDNFDWDWVFDKGWLRIKK